MFENGSAGLVSTADDFNAFAQMMLDGGRLRGERILSRPSVELMITDQITSEQKTGSGIFFGDTRGWGMGMSVFGKREDLCNTPGRFGWDGGYGTSWYSDPPDQLTGILLTQRMMNSPAATARAGGLLDIGLSGDRRLKPIGSAHNYLGNNSMPVVGAAKPHSSC